jgi:hypothetical protein
MMVRNRMVSRAAAILLLVGSAGCFHATVETGLAPSTQVIEKPFASGWIYGLVPPSTVSTAAKCPDGVAKVETQLSFVNQLVSFITFEIYTPMTIKVTCAAKHTAVVAPTADIRVGTAAGSDSIRAAFASAATEALTSGRAVLVQVADTVRP